MLVDDKGVSMADVDRDPLEDVADKLDEIQETLEQMREVQEEIVEKLSNFSLPGVDYSIRGDV